MPGRRGPGHRARVAVVGAGIAGLACARTLVEKGLQVRVFEREACPGGRIATRRVDMVCFDHGVQYFSTLDARFEPVVRQWEAAGIVAPWTGRTVCLDGHRPGEQLQPSERFVGVPTMEAVAIHLSRGLDIRLSTGVKSVRRAAGRWQLEGECGDGLDDRGFYALVLATPSDLALQLLKGQSELDQRIASVSWDPCWAVMLGLARPSGIDFDAAFVSDDPILGWIARESSKPMRVARGRSVESWILHARPDWSRSYLEISDAEASRWLQRAFAARLGRPLAQCTVAAHRWRRALPVNPLRDTFLFDADRAIGLAGDWCGGPRVEGAFLSGVSLARAIAS
jgi:predicted NAD/FAD-dependent oxidoreductase